MLEIAACMPGPHIEADGTARRMRGCHRAAGFPQAAGQAKGAGTAAVLEGGGMAAMAGHCQQLLAGRASRGELHCRLHCCCLLQLPAQHWQHT